MISTPLPLDVAQEALNNGSPFLVKAVGRAFGLADPEQSALGTGTIPGWALVTLGLAAGIVLGVQAQKRFPAQTKWIGGGK